MRKFLIFVAGLVGLAIVCVAIENIPWSNVAAYFTGGVTHAASDRRAQNSPYEERSDVVDSNHILNIDGRR